MDSIPDLSQPSNVISYLAETPFACTQADVLTGGNANFLFRLHLCQPYDGNSTVVLKHGKAQSASGPLPLPLLRQEIEAKVLQGVRPMLAKDALVTVPKVYHYDPKAHFIIMEDCGPSSRTLKQLLIDTPAGLHPDEAKRLGTALGVFLSTVHTQGSNDAQLMSCIAHNTEMRGIIAQYYYGHLVPALTGKGGERYGEKYGELSDADLKTIEALVEEAKESIMTPSPSDSFTVGDFWTGNAIVDTEPDDARGTGYVKLKRVFIVDWEVSKPGFACLDMAQFTAELHTVRSFYPGKDGYSAVDDILPTFFSTITDRMGSLKIGDVCRMTMHIGTHMAVITPVVASWKPRERVRSFVVEAIQYLLKGKRGDEAWLRSPESLLKDLVQSEDAR